MKVATIVPCYGLSTSDVDNLIIQFPKELEAPLFVYNDCDTELEDHLKLYENDRKIQCIYLPYSLGKAEALRIGLKKILKTTNPNIISQIDGRGKQQLSDLPKLISFLDEKNVDMVIGNRYAFQNLSEQPHRAAISTLLSSIIQFLTRISINDAACGFRVYTSKLGNAFTVLKGFGYGLEVEQILIASLNRFKVANYPVSSRLQATVTNAEKIEDNLSILIAYSNELKISDDFRALLCHMLMQIKTRLSFTINIEILNMNVQFKYIISQNGNVSGYASQELKDSYELRILT